jgi:hypothetical protein
MILEYIISNLQRYKEEYKDIEIKRQSLLPSIFEDEINKEYKDLIKFKIINDVSKNLACDYENIMLALEESFDTIWK